MVIKTVSFNQLPMAIKGISAELIKEVNKTRAKTTKQAGQFMIKKAKEMAPHKSEDTKNNIVGNKNGAQYQVISAVPTAFAKNAWVDLRMESNAKMGSYVKHQKTGVSGGGFFTKAEYLTQNKFTNIVVTSVAGWELVK